MTDPSRATYPPLDTLKPIAEDVWIVDGPTIEFGMPWPKMPFPTRMTVIRVGDDLFIHSPTPLTPSLMTEVEEIGTPRWIIGPNRIHYWWIPEWHEVFPDATVWLAPRIDEQAGSRIDFPTRALVEDCGYPWDGHIDTLPVAGGYMTEMVFFHRPSRTLVLTDLIENFQADKLDSAMARWMVRIGGSLDPDGQMPRDMRLTFSRHRAGLQAAVQRMIAWSPERVILAHGRWYQDNGVAELRRAFRWLLD